MMLWLRVRRAWELLAGCLLMVLAVTVLSGEGFALPAVFGSLNVVQWTTFVPLAWSMAVADVLSAKTQAVEARVGGHVARFDLGLFLAATLAGCLAFAGVQAVSGADISTAIAQVLIMTGLAGTLTLRRGPAAAVLGCAGVVVVSTPYGPDAFLGQYIRVLQDDGNPWWALAVGVVLCVAASILVATRRVRVNLSGAESLVG